MTRRLPLLAALLVVALSGMVFLLGARVRDLQEQQVILTRRSDRPHPRMVVPEVRATTLAGDSVRLGTAAADGRQVLFFMNTTCPFCRQSLPHWNRVAAELRGVGAGSELVAVSLDSEAETLASLLEHPIESPVVLLLDGRARALYRANAVPFILVVDSAGRVHQYLRGSLKDREAALDSLRRFASGELSYVAPEPDPRRLRYPR